MFKFLDKTYHINAGGCCFVASVLAKLLERDNVDFTVVVYDCDDCDDFYDIDCSKYHYAIKVGNYVINGEDYEVFDSSEFSNVSSKDLLDHYKECNWNDYYNRKRNNYIKRVIKNFYNDFTSSLREEQPKSSSKR